MNGGEVAAAPADPTPPLEWKFSQVFGERTAGEELQEGTIITNFSFPSLDPRFFWGVCSD